MNGVIRWFTVSREDLLDVLLGEAAPDGKSLDEPSLADLRLGKLALGYRDDDGEAISTLSRPALVVIGDDFATETMSWLRVFADEAFPISQFARVVKLSDWVMFSSKKNFDSFQYIQLQRWASVSVGEALAQAESDVDLENMPLSRLASSVTLQVGRSSHLFGDGKGTQECVSRLRAVSDDSRFARRPISVSQLAPIWTICHTRIEGDLEAHESAFMVVREASEFIRMESGPMSAGGHRFLARYPGLQSDSAEERVISFNEFCDEVLSFRGSELASSGAFLLAAAGFMVGRSTSHVRKTAPMAFVWFGLIAAFAGPRCWDAAWLRAVKGAERLLKPRFDWTDTSSADIGWAEFAWLAVSLPSVDHMIELPKMLPRTLGVEVVPGVTLQVRFGQGSAGDEIRVVPEISAKEQALTDALNQILEVALKVRGSEAQGETPRNRRSSVKSTYSEDVLNLDNGSSGVTSKTSRSKKGKREILSK
jgi:hypothetical protein